LREFWELSGKGAYFANMDMAMELFMFRAIWRTRGVQALAIWWAVFSSLYICGWGYDFHFAYLMMEAYEERKMEKIPFNIRAWRFVVRL